MARLLVIAPIMDVPTTTSFDTATYLADWAKSQGHDVDILKGFAAIRPMFIYEMLKKKPDLVSYYGHGTEDALIGQLIFYSLVDDRSADLFKDTAVHTMACLSSIDLGRAAVNAGARAYYGANHYLMAAFPEPEHNYYGDWRDYMTVIPKALLQGSTTGEAFNRYQGRCTDFIKLYESMQPEWGNADWYVQSTKTNRDRYELLGDKTLRIGQRFTFFGEGGRVPVGVQTPTPWNLKNAALTALFSFSPLLLLAAPVAVAATETQLKKRGYIEQ